MSRPAAYALSTIDVLWRRDLTRFWRQPSRVIGALGQPIIFWLVIGAGMSSTFRLPGQELGYVEYFFPGVATMVLLFASIFGSVSLIEDRHQGFLQAVLAGPASSAALVLGKCLGGASVALLQALVFVALMPLAGYSYATVDWPLLLGTLVLAAVAMSALGFAAAWLIDNVQGYHAVQMTLLVPAWILSGAMFPPADGNAVFAALMTVNPVAYVVAAVRQALYGGAAPAGTVVSPDPLVNFGVVASFAVAALALGVFAATRVRR